MFLVPLLQVYNSKHSAMQSAFKNIYEWGSEWITTRYSYRAVSLWNLYWYLKISCSIAAFSCCPVTTGSLQRVALHVCRMYCKANKKQQHTANGKMLQRRPIHNGNRKKKAIKAHKKQKQLILTANDDNIISCHLFLPHSTDEASASFKRISVQFAYFGFCHIRSCSITLLLGFMCFFLFAGGVF